MKIIKIVLLISLLNSVVALSNGLALTPPLIFVPRTEACQTDEAVVLRQADLLLSLGLASKGYKYVTIEPCWQGQRDKNGRIQEDVNKFPSGIIDIISQLHSKGLLVGLTTDIGNKTFCGKEGSAGYEQIDATTYASWGVDYVRIENSQNLTGTRARMTIMSNFIMQTGRRIMISIDNDGKENVQSWGNRIANTWRTTTSLKSTWESLVSGINKQIGLQIYSGQGAWNDAGILLTDLPIGEFVTQYLVWICLKSPLILTSQLQNLPQDKLKVLLNSQLLSLHQDSLKQQGRLILKEDYVKGWQEVWGGKLSNNRFLLVFLNGIAQQSKMQISLKNDAGINASSYWTRDPLNQVTLGSSSSDNFIVDKVAAHGVEIRVINL